MKIEQLKKIQEIWERREILVEMIKELKARMESAFESECDFNVEIIDLVESNGCEPKPLFEGMFKEGTLVAKLAEISDAMRYNQPGCSGQPQKSKINHKTKLNGLTNMEGIMIFQLLIDFKMVELKGIEKELMENGIDLKP